MHFGENSVDGKPEGEVEDHADDAQPLMALRAPLKALLPRRISM